MKTFKISVLFVAANIDKAIKKAETSILKEPEKLIMGEVDDLNNEIWYRYKEKWRK